MILVQSIYHENIVDVFTSVTLYKIGWLQSLKYGEHSTRATQIKRGNKYICRYYSKQLFHLRQAI